MLCRCTVYINILQSPYTSGLLMNVPNALTTDYINHTADFFPCVFCVVMMSQRTSCRGRSKKVILCATAFVGVCLVFLHTNILTIVPSSNHDNVKTENRVQTSVPGPVNHTLPGIRVAHERVDISEKLPPRSNASVDNAGESRQKRRTILYACRIAECGGWADRQKGVVSAYVLSVLLDRDFKLDMPRPCDVSVFLLPDQFSVAEIFNYVLRKLFKPVPDLRAKMIDLQRSRPQNTKLVCAQVRIGLSQHFDDEKQAKFNTMDSLPVLWNFLRPYNDSANYRIFFASDNKDMIHLAKEKFPTVFLSTPGPVTHLDKYKGPGDNACAGFGHTILDQMVLSTCDVLIMSRSGFGKVASFLRNTDQGLFLFHQSRIVPFLPNENFADRLW